VIHYKVSSYVGEETKEILDSYSKT